MSQQNGQRARFQINRKRRVVRNMRLRTLMIGLKQKPATAAATASLPAPPSRRGPALEAK